MKDGPNDGLELSGKELGRYGTMHLLAQPRLNIFD